MGGLAGAAGWMAGPGPAIGVHFDAASEDNTIDRDTTIEDQAIVVERGPDCEPVTDLVLGGAFQPTNLGARIVLVGCEDFVVSGNRVTRDVGAHAPTRVGSPAGDGGPAAGILLRSCLRGEVRGNEVLQISGGAGAHAEVNAVIAHGGPATGVRVVAGTGVVVAENTLRGLTGGNSGLHESYGAVAGAAVGIGLEGCMDCELTGNTITQVVGGYTQYQALRGGPAWGIRVEEAPGLRLAGNVVGDVAGGPSYAGGRGDATGVGLADSPRTAVDRLLVYDVHLSARATGVRVETSAGVSFERATLADIEDGDDSAGLWIGAGSSVTLVDSIVARTGRWAVFSQDPNAPVNAEVDTSLLWLPGLAEGDADVERVSELDVLRADPLFSPVPDDYHLAEGSPAIDAGRLACVDEPVCDGQDPCLADLGFYAATDEAECRAP